MGSENQTVDGPRHRHIQQARFSGSATSNSRVAGRVSPSLGERPRLLLLCIHRTGRKALLEYCTTFFPK